MKNRVILKCHHLAFLSILEDIADQHCTMVSFPVIVLARLQRNGVNYVRKQLPHELAYAITVHRLQIFSDLPKKKP